MIGELALNASGWHTNLDRAEKAGNAFGRRVSANMRSQLAGIFGVSALTLQTKRTIEYGSRIHDMSKALQVSTKSLQEQEYAITQNGGSLQDLEAGYRALARARTAALEGDAGKMNVFKALGITEQALRAGRLEDTFKAIGEAFRTKDFGSDELGLAMEMLGKGADSLLPAFKAGLQEAADEAERFGLIVGEDVIASLDRAGDAMDRLGKRMIGPFAEAIGFVARFITGVGELASVAGAFAGGFSVDPNPEKRSLFKSSIGRRVQGGLQAARERINGMIEEDMTDRERAARFRAKADAGIRARAEATEAAKVLRLREQIHDLQRKTQMRGLDDTQKEERVLTEIFRKRMELERLRREGKPLSEQLEKQKDLAQLQDELADLREDRRKREAEFALIRPQDSLAKIGALTQFADAYLPLKTPLERIATATETTAVNTASRGIFDPVIGGSF